MSMIAVASCVPLGNGLKNMGQGLVDAWDFSSVFMFVCLWIFFLNKSWMVYGQR